MNRRVPVTVRPGVRPAALLGILLGALVAAGPRPVHADLAAPPAVRAVGVDEHVGATLPLDLRFTDSAQRAVRLGDYFGDGKPVLLVLTYNRCAMLCSLVLRGTGKALAALATSATYARLPGRDYRVVNVSIDPRDTPHEAARKQAVVLEQIGLAGQPARWPFLVGEEPAIRALADRLGFRYAWDARSEQYAHPAVIFVIDPRGRIARYLYGFEFDPRALAAALAGEPDTLAAGRAGLAEAILSCFRFESSARVFGAPIQRLFQGGALLILATLVTGVALCLRRERRRGRARAAASREEEP
jgi:protein SCO1/2